ncbi:MAG: hypothetical protein RL328_1618, partial [Acidobacteriota bacterium]
MFLFEVLGEPFEGGDEAEAVENAGAEFGGDGADAADGGLNLFLNFALLIADFGDGVIADTGIDLHFEGGKLLAELVVDFAGEVLAFGFAGEFEMAGEFAEAGG